MRNYIEATWNDADQYNYSGEQIGNRQRKSGRVHFNPDGSACVASYGDDEPKTSKVSIKDKILPQFKRLQTLQSQMVELEAEYKTTDMSISEYSVLRDVLVAKLQRQEALYKRAVSAKPIKTEEETDELGEETPYSSYDVHYTTPPTSNWLDDFIAELPEKNCFKNFLKIALQMTRKAVEFSQKARNYINELKEV